MDDSKGIVPSAVLSHGRTAPRGSIPLELGGVVMERLRKNLSDVRQLRLFGAPTKDRWLVTASDPSVSVLVQAGSHVEETIPLKLCLESLGSDCRLILPLRPQGLLGPFRSSNHRWTEMVRTLEMMAGHFDLQEIDSRSLLSGVKVLVVFNDWGFGADLVRSAQETGVTVVGWVEGFQDFQNADTDRLHLPYSQCDIVGTVTKGEMEYFPNGRAIHVGSQRIWRMRQASIDSQDSANYVLVNLNFSYGAHSQREELWASEVVSALQSLGMPFLFSRHPASRRPSKRKYPSSGSSSELVGGGSAVVSRSGTMLLEGVACGKPVEYFNPFEERAAHYLLEQIRSISVSENSAQLAHNLGRLRSPSEEEVNCLFPGETPANIMSELIHSLF